MIASSRVGRVPRRPRPTPNKAPAGAPKGPHRPPTREPKMTLRNRARTLALITTLALAAMSAHAPPAHAKPKSPVQTACEGLGYYWSDVFGCADKWCPNPGHGDARPGTEATCAHGGSPQDPHPVACTCNGWTGTWFASAPGPTPHPTAEPRPGLPALAPTPQPTGPGPAAPLPRGIAPRQ